MFVQKTDNNIANILKLLFDFISIFQCISLKYSIVITLIAESPILKWTYWLGSIHYGLNDRVPFYCHRLHIWLQLKKWLSVKNVMIQQHSCKQPRADYVLRLSILNTKCNQQWLVISNAYQCLTRWLVSYTRPCHRNVQLVQRVLLLRQTQIWYLRKSYSDSLKWTGQT